MEVLKSWAVSIVAAAAVTAALSFLSPSGVLDKSIKVITALFMLICFISPFIKADINEDFSSDVEKISEWLSDSKVKNNVEEKVESILESSVHSRISSYLKNKGIEKFAIDVKVNVDESNNIRIQKIHIELLEEFDENALRNFVETEFEVIPAITYCSEE